MTVLIAADAEAGNISGLKRDIDVHQLGVLLGLECTISECRMSNVYVEARCKTYLFDATTSEV